MGMIIKITHLLPRLCIMKVPTTMMSIGMRMDTTTEAAIPETGGIAILWEAVIANVGVALLAILNAVRTQRMKL